MSYFVSFNKTVMDEIDKITASYQSQFAQDIMSLVTVSVTLYVLWKGYQILASKTQTPMQDLVWDLSKFAIIIVFITNADGYLTAATDALQGMKDGFSGGGSPYQVLDSLWERTQNVAEKIYQKDTDFIPLAGASGMLLVWAGSLILMAASVFVFLTADLTMKFLVITAPIFIFCLMFGVIRVMFNNWLQSLFSNVLTVLFATLVVQMAMEFQGDILQQVSNATPNSNIMSVSAMGFMTGLLGALLVFIAKGFAVQLAGAGVEGAVQGAAMMGLGAAGMATGKSLAMGARAGWGFGMGMTGRTGMNSLSGKAGNLMGRGARTAAEWAGEKGYQKLAPTGALGMKARRLASLEKARARNAA
ncbi:TPA: type IV secretion system protein [Escherichia coli]|nr:type IV secretion system protein [Escherichia coli]